MGENPTISASVFSGRVVSVAGIQSCCGNRVGGVIGGSVGSILSMLVSGVVEKSCQEDSLFGSLEYRSESLCMLRACIHEKSSATVG